MMAQRISLLAHRWVGLGIAGFLLMAGTTGSLLAFYDEFDHAVRRLVLGPVGPFEPDNIDVFELRDRAEARLPYGGYIDYLDELRPKESRSVAFFVQYPRGAPQDAPRQVFVDPSDGETMGHRRLGSGEYHDGLIALPPFIYRLHTSLALGRSGQLALGVVALLWTLDCLVGGYLTLPRRKRTRRSLRVWTRQWAKVWLFRMSSFFGAIFTWHRAFALWTWLLLFSVALSAVALNLRQVYDPVVSEVMGLDTPGYRSIQRLSSPLTAPRLSYREGFAVAVERLSERSKRDGFEVIAGKKFNYYRDKGVYRYTAFTSLDVSRRHPTTAIYVDANTGEELAFDQPTDSSAGTTLTTWLHAIHFGSVSVGGIVVQVLIGVLGFGVVTLSVSGAWTWAHRRPKRAGRLIP
ncbi:MAG: PepSY-associated TM helix domain-containing protein [Myxococcota bacterium]